ncbi:unnamed protein product, partial [Didymodactylos carnosus]
RDTLEWESLVDNVGEAAKKRLQQTNDQL